MRKCYTVQNLLSEPLRNAHNITLYDPWVFESSRMESTNKFNSTINNTTTYKVEKFDREFVRLILFFSFRPVPSSRPFLYFSISSYHSSHSIPLTGLPSPESILRASHSSSRKYEPKKKELETTQAICTNFYVKQKMDTDSSQYAAPDVCTLQCTQILFELKRKWWKKKSAKWTIYTFCVYEQRYIIVDNVDININKHQHRQRYQRRPHPIVHHCHYQFDINHQPNNVM